MSDQHDWAKDDAYMLAAFENQLRPIDVERTTDEGVVADGVLLVWGDDVRSCDNCGFVYDSAGPDWPNGYYPFCEGRPHDE